MVLLFLKYFVDTLSQEGFIYMEIYLNILKGTFPSAFTLRVLQNETTFFKLLEVISLCHFNAID